MTKHVGKTTNKASMHNDVLCLQFTPDSIENSDKNRHIFYPSGKPTTPHLLRYQGFAVYEYSVTLDALNLGHSRLLQR
jgi:hypothetical protein